MKSRSRGVKRSLDRSLDRVHGIGIPPVAANTFAAIGSEGNIVITFAWVPPEKRDDTHIVTRVSISKRMADSLVEEITRSSKIIDATLQKRSKQT